MRYQQPNIIRIFGRALIIAKEHLNILRCKANGTGIVNSIKHAVQTWLLGLFKVEISAEMLAEYLKTDLLSTNPQIITGFKAKLYRFVAYLESLINRHVRVVNGQSQSTGECNTRNIKAYICVEPTSQTFSCWNRAWYIQDYKASLSVRQ